MPKVGPVTHAKVAAQQPSHVDVEQRFRLLGYIEQDGARDVLTYRRQLLQMVAAFTQRIMLCRQRTCKSV